MDLYPTLIPCKHGINSWLIWAIFSFSFFIPSAVYSEKVQNVNNNKMFTFWNELHTTDKFKKNYNIHVLIVSWFAICLHVHMHFLTWILWGYYSQPTHLINLILELEICLFRINKKIAFWNTSALYILDILFRLIGII